ncbi:hypothetical protein GQ473_06030 [archaeon]|nr:hypothetical protein [archaeon]
MDIADLLFYDILKIDPYSSIITGEFSHDIVYALLIPSIFLIIMLTQFGKEIFHGGKQNVLVSIAGLAVIIVSGWYGAIASFSAFLFPALLGFFILKFLYRMVISQKTSGAAVNAAAWGSKKFQKKYGNVLGAPLGGREERELQSKINDAKNAHKAKRETQERYDKTIKQEPKPNAPPMDMTIWSQTLSALTTDLDNRRGIFTEKIKEIRDFIEEHNGANRALEKHIINWENSNEEDEKRVYDELSHLMSNTA